MNRRQLMQLISAGALTNFKLDTIEVTGHLVVLRYPPGYTIVGRFGDINSEVDNADIAQGILNSLLPAKSIAIPIGWEINSYPIDSNSWADGIKAIGPERYHQQMQNDPP